MTATVRSQIDHNAVAENPKTLVGRTKTPTLSPVPSTSLAWLAEAHLDGARKYGALNWREKDIPLTVYIDAAIRHLLRSVKGKTARRTVSSRMRRT